MSTFEALVAEGEAVPTEGWDFSWFDGRATEQRPSWGYARLLAERASKAEAALDIQTGGGEVLAFIPVAPPALAGFTVDAYRDRLAELHDVMQRHGPFVAYSQRFLIEARKKA